MFTKNNVGLILLVSCFGLAALIVPSSLAWGLLTAAVIIAIVGALDEQYHLTPGQQLLGQFLAVAALVGAGWAIPYVTNPFGAGVLLLGSGAGLAALIWLLGLINAVNWLDGVDGLAGGVGLVTFGALAVISILPGTTDPITLRLALIGLGGMAVFLLWNWPPATVYLGTTGSWWLGAYIGLVAIIGRGKIITTLLVLAWPIIDVGLVIGQRLWAGQAPWRGDRRHLHHRLLALGFSARHITILAMLVSAVLAGAVISLAWRGGDCHDFNQGKIQLGNKVWPVALAQSAVERERGLGGCKNVPDGHGMYFSFPTRQTAIFWMRGMVIPIDIIWISGGRVVGIEANVPAPADPLDPNPPLYTSLQPIDGVLEIGSGQAAKYGVTIGNSVKIF